ncbi:hypothetical protein [Arenimonas metalli]|uniref:DUF4190 domain-containing protein n=1 Tax=Arenimonas metalli CF5-1 TaxID=1384056 RepID=A0A091B4S7_9GAMM|nr:hypothetical protein [Arenimonas metalli]KFN46726.1 hypothetical protein N787_09425 [Arenimonas metalli CF5-1]
MTNQTTNPSRHHVFASGSTGLVLVALALVIHPAFFIPALVAFSLPLLKQPGQRSWGWAGLVFALVATQVVIGYTLGKDAALRDNAAAESRQAD